MTRLGTGRVATLTAMCVRTNEAMLPKYNLDGETKVTNVHYNQSCVFIMIFPTNNGLTILSPIENMRLRAQWPPLPPER